MDLGLSEERFWSLTPRELEALYRQKTIIEARTRFYIATSMGAKAKNGQPLQLDDFLPYGFTKKKAQPWQEQLAIVKGFMENRQNRVKR